MPDKLIPFCKLYENTRKMTVKRYFVGTLSFTSKLLIFQNENAKEGEPGWTLFITEREQKLEGNGDRRSTTHPKPEVGDFGGLAGGDYPTRQRRAA